MISSELAHALRSYHHTHGNPTVNAKCICGARGISAACLEVRAYEQFESRVNQLVAQNSDPDQLTELVSKWLQELELAHSEQST